MLHLVTVDSYDEAEDIRQRFNASGIPLFIESDYKREYPRGEPVGFRIHLWLDEQLEDAKRLLRDPDYEVLSPVDIAAFYATLQEHDDEKNARFKHLAERWLGWLMGLAILAFLAWVAYGALTS